MNWSPEDCKKLQQARDETRLEKRKQKKQEIYRDNRAKDKNLNNMKVSLNEFFEWMHCCSRFVMSVVPAIGSWLLAVWVMLAPRTAKLSGGLAETPGRGTVSC